MSAVFGLQAKPVLHVNRRGPVSVSAPMDGIVTVPSMPCAAYLQALGNKLVVFSMSECFELLV